MTYDDLGRLIKDEDSVGGFKALSRTEGDSSYTVDVSTAEGVTNSYTVESLSPATQRGLIQTPMDYIGMARNSRKSCLTDSRQRPIFRKKRCLKKH